MFKMLTLFCSLFPASPQCGDYWREQFDQRIEEYQEAKEAAKQTPQIVCDNTVPQTCRQRRR